MSLYSQKTRSKRFVVTDNKQVDTEIGNIYLVTSWGRAILELVGVHRREYSL